MGNESELKPTLLEVRPKNIDCGSLKLGHEAKAKLNILGGPGKVLINNDQIKVTPTSFEFGDNVIEISLVSPGYEELIWDDIIIETDAQKLKVPITVRWTNSTVSQTTFTENETSVSPPYIEAKIISIEQRSFMGQSCSACGKNLSYDSNRGTWEQCKCAQTKFDIKSKPPHIQSESKPMGNWVLTLIGTLGIPVGIIYGIVKLFAQTQDHLAYFSPAFMSVIVFCIFLVDYNKSERRGSLLALWILGFLNILAAVFIPDVRWFFIILVGIVAIILGVRYTNPMKRTM